MVGILVSTTIRKKHVSPKTVCNPLTLDLQLLVYVSLGQSADLIKTLALELDYDCLLIPFRVLLRLLCKGLTVYFVRLTLDLTSKFSRSNRPRSSIHGMYFFNIIQVTKLMKSFYFSCGPIMSNVTSNTSVTTKNMPDKSVLYGTFRYKHLLRGVLSRLGLGEFLCHEHVLFYY